MKRILTLLCIILKNDQTYFKNVVVFTPQDFQSIFGHFRSSHRRCSAKKVSLEISQNWQEKKKTLAQVFSSEFCEISKNTFFTEHLLVAASIIFNIIHKKINWIEFSPNFYLRDKVMNSAFQNLSLTWIMRL